jgi:2-oxoglutarate ferredoxin oxidoreductase subunit delta
MEFTAVKIRVFAPESEQLMKSPVVINEAWCKGCDICVDFCPTDVLEMHKGKAVVVRPEDCTGCLLCEIHCPDLAIKVDVKLARELMKKKKQAAAAGEGK